MSASAGAQPKRGPGRPRKNQAPPPLSKDGIVESPSDPANKLELVYEDPGMLKSLFAYFKNLKAVDIHIRCSPTGITFFTRGGDDIRIVAELPGESMNHFYCEEEFWLGLNRNNVERVFSSVDKSFDKITMIQRNDDPDSLTIIFKDRSIEKDCQYKVSVSTLDDDDELFAAEKMATAQALESFPVNFQLTSRQFKKSVTDASYHSETITIEKPGSHPLQFTYTKVGIAYNEVYHSGEKINLHSTVEDSVFFRSVVSVSNIKALASAMVTDTVQIYCREDDDMLFRSEIDALTMCTFVKVQI